jgi:multidrug transporter EmrE-like cation transporter
MAREIILFLLVVCAGTGGELCVSRAMKTVGEVKEFHPAALFSVVLRCLRIKWMWLGLALMATAFFSLLWVLSFANVSLVVPVTALSYAAGTVGGKIFLRERVTPQRWLGVALVTVGVTLVLIGRN